MKWILSTIVLTMAIGAFASDKKIGNVILVERTIENVFDTCTTGVEREKGDNPQGSLFACTLQITNSTQESVPPGQWLLRLRTDNCAVDADVSPTKAIVFFSGTSDKANYASAKACLTEALNKSPNKDSFKILVQTVE